MAKWLSACAKAIRTFLYPTQISINTPIAGQETGELLDLLPGTVEESLLAEAIAQEEEEIQATRNAQINQALTNAIAQLGTEDQTLLQLYYQEGLTQQQIAQRRDVKQYTVSRQLSRIKQTLLQKLAQWSKETLHVSLTAQVLDSMSHILEEWLTTYHCSPDSAAEEL